SSQRPYILIIRTSAVHTASLISALLNGLAARLLRAGPFFVDPRRQRKKWRTRRWLGIESTQLLFHTSARSRDQAVPRRMEGGSPYGIVGRALGDIQSRGAAHGATGGASGKGPPDCRHRRAEGTGCSQRDSPWHCHDGRTLGRCRGESRRGGEQRFSRRGKSR